MSLSKNKLKLIQSLKLVKYRQKYNKILVEGLKICLDILKLYSDQIEEIFIEENWAEEHLDSLGDTQFESISRKEMSVISQLKNPSPILIICKLKAPSLPDIENIGKGALYFDGIRDPGNMGTIIRTADWFGVGEIWCSEDCVDLYNQKVIQASMGSIFHNLPKIVKSMVQKALQSTPGRTKGIFAIRIYAPSRNWLPPNSISKDIHQRNSCRRCWKFALINVPSSPILQGY